MFSSETNSFQHVAWVNEKCCLRLRGCSAAHDWEVCLRNAAQLTAWKGWGQGVYRMFWLGLHYRDAPLHAAAAVSVCLTF